MSRRLRVGLDLDGVCYDFSGSLRQHLVTNVGGAWTAFDFPDPDCWEFYEDWGLDLGAFLLHCHDGVDAGVIFSHGDPLPRVREACQWIKAAGHSIHVVTDRSFGKPGAAARATLDWLARHEIQYDSVTFSADKTIAAVDVMVDDKPENYAALTAAGVDAYLLSQPWNMHVEGAQRVLDLLHFAEVIR